MLKKMISCGLVASIVACGQNPSLSNVKESSNQSSEDISEQNVSDSLKSFSRQRCQATFGGEEGLDFAYNQGVCFVNLNKLEDESIQIKILEDIPNSEFKLGKYKDEYILLGGDDLILLASEENEALPLIVYGAIVVAGLLIAENAY